MSANGWLAAAVHDMDGDMEYIPQHHEPQCCCGAMTCAFLQETRAAFDRLDQSLHTAGALGQALLVRHEAYVAESESERRQLRDGISRLSRDRDALQDQNSQVIEENRRLLQDLELANSAVEDADAHVSSLTATLKSTQDEIQRLNLLARRTQALEQEIERFEQDQARLHTSLLTKTEQERAAVLRWQESERALSSLEDRIEAVEDDARLEREQHVEIVSRLERRRLVEKELESAAGRLKGAAPTKGSKDVPGSTGVVTHFVKDILQDNANLQLSVVELRDLLSNANEQVERLREQLDGHLSQDPVACHIREDLPPDKLDPALARHPSSREVHVHHHYHGPKPESSRRHSQVLRKPKKRRQGISFGQFPYHAAQRTQQAVSAPAQEPSLATGSKNEILGSSPPSLRLTTSLRSFSNGTAASTIPSSPRSHTSPMIMDRVFSDGDLDSSRPTTPGTEVCDSPQLGALRRRADSRGFFQPLDATLLDDGDSTNHLSSPPRAKPLSRPESAQSVRLDDDEAGPEHSLVDFSMTVPRLRPFVARLRPIRSMTDEELPAHGSEEPRLRSHHRVNSHESLLSVSGMDIHTLRSRPSQMLTGQNTRSFSSEATVTVTTALAARPSLATSASQDGRGTGLGQRVSGWVFGRLATGQSTISPLNPAKNAAVALQEETYADDHDDYYDDYDEHSPGPSHDGRSDHEHYRDEHDRDEHHHDEYPYNQDDGHSTRGTEHGTTEDDSLFQRADHAGPGRGGAEEELERMLGEMGPDDPRRLSIEREYARLMEGSVWRFGLCSPFG